MPVETPGRSSRGPVRFEGVLKKQEVKGTGTTWAAKYFVLSDNLLSYFRIKDTTIVERENFAEVVTNGQPVGTFDLARTEAHSSDQKDGQSFVLYPGGGEESVSLLATSREEAAAWVSAIQKSKLQVRGVHDTPQGSTNAGSPSASNILGSPAAATGVGAGSFASLGGEAEPSVNQLRIQLREAQLRHEATLDANKKALAAVGTKHYQEKQALLEKIALLEGRLGDGFGSSVVDLEAQVSALQGELDTERSKATDALQRLEANANRVHALQAEVEGTRALLAVEKQRSTELQEQLSASKVRNAELQADVDRFQKQEDVARTAANARRAAGGSADDDTRDVLIAELRSKCTGMEHAMQAAERRAAELANEVDRLRINGSSVAPSGSPAPAPAPGANYEQENRIAALQRAADAANSEVARLRNELEQAHNAARSQASMGSPSAYGVASPLTAHTPANVNNNNNATERALETERALSSRFQRENEALADQVARLRDDLAEERRRSADRLRSVEVDRSRSDMDRQRMMNRIEGDAQAFEQVTADVAQTEVYAMSAARQLEDERRVNAQLRQRVDDLVEELGEGRDMLGEAEKRVAAAVRNAEREVESERVRCDELEASLGEAVRAAQHKDGRVAELERAVSDRRAQQEAMTQHFDQVVEGLRADASAAVARATASEQRAASAEAELEAVLSTRTSSDRMATQAARQLRDLRAELEDAMEDRDGSGSRLKDLQKRYEMSTALVEQYKRTNDRLSREVEQMQRELQLAGMARNTQSPGQALANMTNNSNNNNLSSFNNSAMGYGSGPASAPAPAPNPAAMVSNINNAGAPTSNLTAEAWRQREAEAEAKYAELVRASDTLVEEMTREKTLLLDRIAQLEQNTGGANQNLAALRRENAELIEKNERDLALCQHLRRQLEERDIQLDDKSRQILEVAMTQNSQYATRAGDLGALEQEVMQLRAHKARVEQQIMKQQAVLDSKDQAVNRERQVMQETLRVERVARAQIEEEVARLRTLAAVPIPQGNLSSNDLTSPGAEMERSRLQASVDQLTQALRTRDESYAAETQSLRTMLQEEQQARLRCEQQLQALGGAVGMGDAAGRIGDLERQVATLTQERDGLQQRILALKDTLYKKEMSYRSEIDALQMQLRSTGGQLMQSTGGGMQ